jgi:hypothetical protein
VAISRLSSRSIRASAHYVVEPNDIRVAA